MRVNTLPNRATACTVALLLLAGTAVALTGGPTLVGKNGVSPVRLFGKADVRTELADDWDHDGLTIGFQNTSSLGVSRTLAVTSDGTDTLIYVPVRIADATEGDYMGVIEVTVDGDDIAAMRTVCRVPWDRDLASPTWTRPFSGLALVHDGVGTTADGDLLVTRQELSPDSTLDMVVYAVDPSVGDLVEVYRDVEGPYLVPLAAMADGSGGFILGQDLVGWDGTEFAGDAFFGSVLSFQSRFAVGTDGDLYGTLNVTDTGSSKNTGIYAVDPTGDDDYLRVGTTKLNGVWNGNAAAFDSKGKLWHVDKKKNDYFLSKANKKGKLPYKKRIAEWSATDERARLVELEALGTSLFGLVLETGTGSFPANTGQGEDVEIWRLDP